MKFLLARSPLTLLAIVAAFLFSGIFAGSAHAQLVVIVNPGVKGAEVSTADLRDVFSGNSSTLKGGSTISPILLKQGTTHEEFLTRIIGKSDTAFRAAWRSLVFSGQGSMPRTLDSESAIVEYVAHTPGAIGYISRATPHEGVKTLTVR